MPCNGDISQVHIYVDAFTFIVRRPDYGPQGPKHVVFKCGTTVPSGPRPHHCRSFTIILRHTTFGRTPLDGWSRDLYLITHNSRQTSMLPAGSETPNPSKWTAVGPRFRMRGCWERPNVRLTYTNAKYTDVLDGIWMFVAYWKHMGMIFRFIIPVVFYTNEGG